MRATRHERMNEFTHGANDLSDVSEVRDTSAFRDGHEGHDGQDVEWQRLDPRMLLVHPLRELARFLPVLLVIALGSAGGVQPWQVAGVGIPVALGVMRYLTTRFRIDSGRIELQRGLLNRRVLSTPVDRVRTVDLTSSPIYRILGLTKVRIGTGTASTNDEDRIDLDGLPLERARALRVELLHATAAESGPEVIGGAAVVLTFDPAWVRFAPLTGTGFVIGAAAIGALAQLLESLGSFGRIDIDGVDLPGRSLAVLVPALGLGFLVVISVLSICGYAVTNWGFRVAHSSSAATWQITRGLFTTRETTLDDERVSGVSLAEPLGLRLVKGARLSAIATGLAKGQWGSAALVPPAPIAVAQHVATRVVGDPAPITAPLTPHGGRAARRRWTRAAVPAALIAGACLAAVWLGGPRWLLIGLLAFPVGALLAVDRTRSLGHTLVAGFLVARSGSLVRRRRALGTDHIIGWNFRATWFQRRAGLTTLVATTAGGNQAVPIIDVPEQDAVAVAHAALPDLLLQFTLSGDSASNRS